MNEGPCNSLCSELSVFATPVPNFKGNETDSVGNIFRTVLIELPESESKDDTFVLPFNGGRTLPPLGWHRASRFTWKNLGGSFLKQLYGTVQPTAQQVLDIASSTDVASHSINSLPCQ